MLIALTNPLPKALSAFSRFHSVVIRLMLLSLLTYLSIRTRWDINQLCHPMHVPSGMLKKHVMPSHLKRTLFCVRRIQVYPELLLQGPANRLPEQAWRALVVRLRYYLHRSIIKQSYCTAVWIVACRVKTDVISMEFLAGVTWSRETCGKLCTRRPRGWVWVWSTHSGQFGKGFQHTSRYILGMFPLEHFPVIFKPFRSLLVHILRAISIITPEKQGHFCKTSVLLCTLFQHAVKHKFLNCESE